MTATELDVRPVPTDSDDDDLMHLFCCDEDISICGKDLSGHDTIDDKYEVDQADTCIVCAMITRCTKCQKVFQT